MKYNFYLEHINQVKTTLMLAHIYKKYMAASGPKKSALREDQRCETVIPGFINCLFFSFIQFQISPWSD